MHPLAHVGPRYVWWPDESKKRTPWSLFLLLVCHMPPTTMTSTLCSTCLYQSHGETGSQGRRAAGPQGHNPTGPPGHRATESRRAAEPQSHRATEPQRNRAAQPQSHRETEKQGNRETGKQGNRETEKQRNRETEKQRNRETEKQNHKATKPCNVHPITRGLGQALAEAAWPAAPGSVADHTVRCSRSHGAALTRPCCRPPPPRTPGTCKKSGGMHIGCGCFDCVRRAHHMHAP